jgi:hypothetical protein
VPNGAMLATFRRDRLHEPCIRVLLRIPRNSPPSLQGKAASERRGGFTAHGLIRPIRIRQSLLAPSMEKMTRPGGNGPDADFLHTLSNPDGARWRESCSAGAVPPNHGSAEVVFLADPVGRRVTHRLPSRLLAAGVQLSNEHEGPDEISGPSRSPINDTVSGTHIE